jgi:hypothetical protein
MAVEQPPAIKFTTAGAIAVNATSYCGDGDVVSFAGSNPSFDFIPNSSTTMDAIAGYWIVEEGATGNALLPTSTNWQPIAYKKIPLTGTGSSDGHFFSISQNVVPTNKNVMKLISSDLINLYSAAKESFESKKKFKVFTAILSCVNPDGAENLITDGSGTYEATPIELVHSLKEINSEVNEAFDTTNLSTIKNNKKVKIDFKAATDRNLGNENSPKPYDFSLGNQGEPISGPLYDTYENILDASFPTLDDTPSPEEYTTEMVALGWHNGLKTGMAGDKIDYCNAQGANSDKDAKKYPKFEPFPLNLSCKNLFTEGSNTTALVDSYNALFNPAVVPSEDDFKTAKKALAKRFFMAAVYQTAQVYFNTKDTVAKSGCFQKPGQPHLINRIVASYPLNYAVGSAGNYVISGNLANHLHPEWLFAISDKNNYFANDAKAIWGQTVGGQNIGDVRTRSINLPLNDPQLLTNPVTPATFGGAAININFKARHKDEGEEVAGVCIVYC